MHRIRVLYDPRQQADGNTSFSPSASKPARAVASWLGAGLPIDILSFDPAPISLLRRVHDPAYVDGVLSCGRVNGFQNRNPAVASSLPWTVGSMIAAAREALSNMRVACSPTSGFHHAERLGGGDFCTFNGLIAAVVAVLDDGFDRKVGIIDLDAHWANGTVDILAAMPDVAARSRSRISAEVMKPPSGSLTCGSAPAWKDARGFPHAVRSAARRSLPRLRAGLPWCRRSAAAMISRSWLTSLPGHAIGEACLPTEDDVLEPPDDC
jgi:hypothetical protein